VKGVGLLFLVSLVFGGVNYWDEEKGVDYWNLGEKKEEGKKSEALRAYEESRKWFPPNVSPIERYFYQHPEDKEAQEYLFKFYQERIDRANQLRAVILQKQQKRENEVKEVLSKVQVLYFYSKSCPSCVATDPLIQTLSETTTVFRIDVENAKNRKYVYRYRVFGTPTIVFIDSEGKEVGRWIGPAVWDERFRRFLLNLRDKL